MSLTFSSLLPNPYDMKWANISALKVHEKCLVMYKLIQSWKKISVITDISVLRFYGYIGYIGDISADILEKNIGRLKIVKNL